MDQKDTHDPVHCGIVDIQGRKMDSNQKTRKENSVQNTQKVPYGDLENGRFVEMCQG